MPLKPCPNCGKEISDRAKKCVHCGYDLTQITMVICPDCGSTIEKGTTECPKCGCPLDDVEGLMADESQVDSATDKNDISLKYEKQRLIDSPSSNTGMLINTNLLAAKMAEKNEKAIVPVNNEPLVEDDSVDRKRHGSLNSIIEKIKAYWSTNRGKIRKIIPLVILLLAAIALIAGISHSNSVKKQYMADAQKVSEQMLSNAAEAEDCYNLIMKVWRNTIFENSDEETDKFTIGPAGLYWDIDRALRNLYQDPVFSLRANSLLSKQDNIASLLKELSDPPKEYQEVYDRLEKAYLECNKMVDLVKSIDGTYLDYTSSFNSADTDFLSAYDSLKLLFEE